MTDEETAARARALLDAANELVELRRIGEQPSGLLLPEDDAWFRTHPLATRDTEKVEQWLRVLAGAPSRALPDTQHIPSVSEAVTVIAKYGEEFVFGDSQTETFTFERLFDSGRAFTVTVKRDLSRESAES